MVRATKRHVPTLTYIQVDTEQELDEELQLVPGMRVATEASIGVEENVQNELNIGKLTTMITVMITMNMVRTNLDVPCISLVVNT